MTPTAPEELVGRSAVVDDVADRHRWRAFRRFFDLGPEERALGFHWLLFTDLPEQTRPDGHAESMAPFPPLTWPRRMWAGGEVRWHGAIEVDDRLTRRSTIVKAEPKSGSGGEFLLAAVEHHLTCGDGARIAERQDVVFLPEPSASARPDPGPPPFSPEWIDERAFGPVDLFRYSALTLNSHRIHYDAAYSTGVERYRGLVAHGPLLASTLMHSGVRRAGTAEPATFAYRAVAPAFADERLTFVGRRGDGGRMDLAACGPDGGVRMHATMTFGEAGC